MAKVKKPSDAEYSSFIDAYNVTVKINKLLKENEFILKNHCEFELLKIANKKLRVAIKLEFENKLDSYK